MENQDDSYHDIVMMC